MQALDAWDSFYVVIGSAAGALIGLQFVVLTLIADRPSLRSEEGGAAFSTPTVVHFCTALLLAALMTAPWHRPGALRLALGAIGLFGLGYGIVIVRHMLSQHAYKPVLVDWISNVAVPVTGYALLVASAFVAPGSGELALYGIAAAALVLLFVGIYNSWDSISYHALSAKSGERSNRVARAGRR